MKKLIFFSMLFLASIVTHAQLTSYGDLIMGDAGDGGRSESSFFGTKAGDTSFEDRATFIGFQAGLDSKSNSNNDTIIGHNTFVGAHSGENNIGKNNTFMGAYSGMNSSNNTGVNTFIGAHTGQDNTGYKNTFLGGYAGASNTGGRENTFVGAAAGGDNVGGYYNVFVGAAAGRSSNGGVAHHNTYIGYQAGFSNLTGAHNVFLGNKAGELNTGTGNIFLGNRAGANEIEGSNRLYIDNSDTGTPLIYGDFSANNLTFNADLCIAAPDGNTELDLKSTDNNSGWHNQIRFFDNTNLRHVIADNFTDGRLVISPGFGGNATNLVQVNGSLLVGNGALPNTPPGYDLYVTEGILTEKVKVTAYIDWADYVFEEDYDLNTAQEVEQFIKANKHLPNVPSAKEVNENGVDMVEMDATLLRQIEELWLHVIDLKKENDTLKDEVKTLKSSK